MFRLLFHLSVVVINTSGLFYYLIYLDHALPVTGMKTFPLKGKSIYLAIWCMILQTVYYLVALLNDIVGTNEPTQLPPIIRRIKDVLFTLALPLALYVTVLVYITCAIDPTMLAPVEAFSIIPPIINHVLHNTISLFIIIELLLPHKNYPSRKFGLSLLYSFIAIYIVWFFFIYRTTGAGVYPFYGYLDVKGRVSFLIVSCIAFYIFYTVGEQINSFICSKNSTHSNVKNKINRKIKKRV